MEEKIIQKSQFTQSLINHHSSAMARSLQKLGEDLIKKEKENAFRDQALRKLQWDTTATVEEQYPWLEDVTVHLTTSLTPEVEIPES